MVPSIHPLAGKHPDPSTLVTEESLRIRYHNPEPPLAPIKNGTSGHRGLTGSGFSDLHVAAITQALVEIRRERGTYGPDLPAGYPIQFTSRLAGPIITGKDVRYTSDFAQRTVAEVFAGNGQAVLVQRGDRATPTPVVSHAILSRNNRGGKVEGVILTASHNPPDEAGYKSNGLNGGPNTRTRAIDELANRFLAEPGAVKRMPYDEAVRRGLVVEDDFMMPYVRDLASLIRFDVIRGQRFGATPLGGASNGYYEAISSIHGLDIRVALAEPDPASAHKTYDWDGRLRGDPSSAYVMQVVNGIRQKFDVPFVGANDNDADRFGGEDATAGILNPNHVICVLFDYLARERNFPASRGVGRTIGTTHMLDLIARDHGRPVEEVNVGFKYYVDGLITGKYVLAAEESAGLSFPRLDGSTWVTEKDGIAAVLLIMEVIARTGKDIGTLYQELVRRYGPHHYERIDAPATDVVKKRINELAAQPAEVEKLLLGKRIANRSIERLVVGDGIKVVLEGGVWVLKRPSGTENIVKDYREERGDSIDTARRASVEIDHLLGLSQ